MTTSFSLILSRDMALRAIEAARTEGVTLERWIALRLTRATRPDAFIPSVSMADAAPPPNAGEFQIRMDSDAFRDLLNKAHSGRVPRGRLYRAILREALR